MQPTRDPAITSSSSAPFQWTAESDFLWCAFVAAAQSYKHDSVLQPFPSLFLDPADKSKQIDALRRCIDDWTPYPADAGVPPPSGALQDLVQWTCATPSFSVRQESDPAAFLAKLLQDTGDASAAKSPVGATPPRAVFTLRYAESDDARFEARAAPHRRLWAWHGTQLAHLHSILHHGLQNVRNRNAVFGQGTYLSSELAVALSFAPTGAAWRHSRLGARLSVVLLCELIDSTEGGGLMRHTSDPARRAAQSAAAAADTLGTGADAVPERYFLVRNDELVRVRHVILFGIGGDSTDASVPGAVVDAAVPAAPRYEEHAWRPLQRLLRRNLTLLMMLGYVMLLLSASMSQSHMARDFGRTLRNFIWDSSDSESDFVI